MAVGAKNLSPLQRLARWYLARGQRRAFEAARYDRLRLGWTLRSAHLSADEEIYADLTALRARAREQAINNPYARRYYQLLRTQVLGPEGPRYQCMARRPDGSRDSEAAAVLEAAWVEWTEGCDAGGRWPLAELLELYLTGAARDGEALVRRLRGWEGNRFRYALQLLDADRLDLHLNRDLPDGTRIRMGVELDAWGAPRAYHLLEGPRPALGYSYGGRNYRRYPAEEILHGWLPWRAEQSRGVPWGHAAMVELYHLKEYRTSEMIAAELGAKRLGFYEQDPEAFDEPPASAEQPEIDETVEAGVYRLLPYGVKFREAITNHPASSFSDFLKSGLRGVAAGFGVSYNRLGSDLEGVNFSSLRSGELDDRDSWRQCQRWVGSSFLLPIQRDWLEMSLTVGALPYSIRDYARLAPARFRARGWAWVSPRDEATANAAALASRTTSRQRICRERGEDWAEVLEELAEEEAALRAAGLGPSAEASGEAGEGEQAQDEKTQQGGDDGRGYDDDDGAAGHAPAGAGGGLDGSAAGAAGAGGRALPRGGAGSAAGHAVALRAVAAAVSPGAS